MKYLEYQENLTRGTEGFPVSYYHITSTHPRYHMPPHWHNEYEIIRVLRGSIRLMLNREEIHLKQGEAVVVNSGFLHSGTPENDCCYECIVFDMDYFLKVRAAAPEIPSDLLNQQKRIRSFFPSSETEFHQVFSVISHALSSRQTGYTLITEGAILYFLGLILRKNRFTSAYEHGIARSKKSGELKTVLNYIALHYPDPISLSDLAGCVHMNPNYFCRFFREMTRKSPMAYLNYYRIECACEKLCISNDSILNIALDCGFRDVNYFIKVFKKHKGTTPLQYIKQKTYSSN